MTRILTPVRAIARFLKLVFVLAAVSFLTPAVLAAEVGSDIEAESSAYYESAVRYHHEGVLEAAIIELKNALQTNENHLPARILLGRLYLEIGQPVAAEKELKQSRRLGADERLLAVPLAEVYLALSKFDLLLREFSAGNRTVEIEAALAVLRGKTHLQQGDVGAAIKAFESAGAQNPSDPDPLLGLAIAALRVLDIERAVNLIEQAKERYPNAAEVWYINAEIERQGKNPEAALEHYSRTLELDPDHRQAIGARAATYLDLHRFDKALEDIETILERAPEDAQALFYKSIALERSGDTEGAALVLQEAALYLKSLQDEGNITDAPTLLLSGYVSYSQGNLEKASKDLDRFVRDFPGNVPAHMLLAKSLLQMGRPTAARDAIQPILVFTDDDPSVLLLSAQIHTRLGEHDLAAYALEQAVAIVPDSAALRTDLAFSLLGSGRKAAATEVLDSIFSDGGKTDEQALVLLSALLLDQARFDSALKVVSQLLEHEADDPVLLNISGAALVGLERFDEARARFEKLLSVSPGYAPARVNLAELDTRDGNLDQAQARYEALLTDDPENITALRGMAKLAEKRGDLDEVVVRLEKIRAATPDAITEQLKLVGVYMSMGKSQEAGVLITDLEQRFPDDLRVLLSVGRYESEQGKLDGAKVTYQRMSRLAGHDARWLEIIATNQTQAGDVDGALWSLQKALTGDPSSIGVRSKMVRLHAGLGDFESALAGAEALRALSPQSIVGDILIGDVQMMRSRHEEALEAYAGAMSIAPSAEVAVRQYRALWESGDPPGAIAVLESWEAGHPGDVMVIRSLAAGYLHMESFDEAIGKHQMLLELRPDDALAHNNLAWLYNRQGDSRALEHARRAYELAPEEPSILDTIGWVLVKFDRPGEALRYFREAISRQSDDDTLKYHLAVALHALGRDGEARQTLEKLVGRNAQFAEKEDATELFEKLELQTN